MQLIKVTCKGGVAKVEVEGCAGQGCQSLTERIERALGTPGSPDYKPEFYQETQEQAIQ